MKNNRFFALLAHLNLILALMVLVFFVIDRYNTAMELMTSDMSKWVIGALALVSTVNCIHKILMHRKAAEKEQNGEVSE